MKIFTQISAAVLAVAACIGANAQTAENNTMYLIKGDHVVGKYDVDAVDYVSFKLPEGVIDASLWVSVADLGKNTVSYTVNTSSNTVAYAHGLVPYADMNMLALEYNGAEFDNLDEEAKVKLLQSYLPYCGYLGVGADTYTLKDWDTDVYGKKITVKPGTRYFVCAWEVDPSTQAPLETFSYVEAATLDPDKSTASLSVNFIRQNEQGLAFDIQGSDDINYVVTAYGYKKTMEEFVEVYGLDYLLDTFGGQWTISELQGENELGNGIEAATWPVYDTGEYVLYVRAYDYKGDIVDAKCVATAQAVTSEGPSITIFSKEKGEGRVSINFEISPSNVTEAYVRLLPENDLDDLLNDKWEYYEIASSSQATDIVDAINTMGEYTYTNNELGQMWYSLLVYAKDKDGARATLRINFYPDNETQWDVYSPKHAPQRKAAMAKIYARGHRPTINRVK